MIARVRKKFVLFLPVIFAFFPDRFVTQSENGSVVMKINDDLISIQPSMMISQHNFVMKEKRRVNNTQKDDKQNSSVGNNEITNFHKLYFPHNLRIVEEVLKNLKNEQCAKDTTQVLDAMTRHERWALEMFDSFPKFPVGILYGNYYQLGNFDECVTMKQFTSEEGIIQPSIRGQYCLADIHFTHKDGNNERSVKSLENVQIKSQRATFNSSLIHWGICLPSSCTTLDAEIFTKEIFVSAAEAFEVSSVKVAENKCYYEETTPISTLELAFGCILGFFLILTVLATGMHCWFLKQRTRSVAYNVDALREQKPSILKQVFLCFSIINTTGKFLQTKPNELNLECICGIKFISMSLIIAGHSLIFIFGGPIENRNFFEEHATRVENVPFLNNALLVDTFLLVSGFLMCRLLLLELDKKKGKVNFAVLYLARYIRLTPSYFIVIGLYSTYLNRLGSGPLWKSRVGLERDRCLESWWANILYINNYVNTDHLCMFQSWYLSVDYHLFIIAPFIVYPLWRWKRFGETLLFVCTALSAAIPFWITYTDKLDPTLMAYFPEIEDLSKNHYFINVYVKTHMRASSYCIGLFFGYVVHKLQTSGTKIPSYVSFIGWTVSILLGIIAMSSIVVFYNPNHEINSIESAVYASLHRIAWSLAIGWVLVVCITENAAIINKFLSFKAFIPASRLTYCAYLANGIVEVYNIGVLRQATYLSKYELICKTFGHAVLTYTLAFFLCIIFESPIHGLEKLLLSRAKVREAKQNPTLRPIEES